MNNSEERIMRNKSMREIKFKGIALYGKDFVFGSLLIEIDEAGRTRYYIKKRISKIEVKKESVGQYTEYNDSEDTEIYEDDIFDWGKHSRGVVKVVKGQWVFSNKNGDFSVHGYREDGKVIGNISTHAHLLEHEDVKH